MGKYVSRVIFQGRLALDKGKLDDIKNPKSFTAYFDTDLNLLSLAQSATNYSDYSSNVDYDSYGNKYEVGSFTNSKTFDKNIYQCRIQ